MSERPCLPILVTFAESLSHRVLPSMRRRRTVCVILVFEHLFLKVFVFPYPPLTTKTSSHNRTGCALCFCARYGTCPVVALAEWESVTSCQVNSSLRSLFTKHLRPQLGNSLPPADWLCVSVFRFPHHRQNIILQHFVLSSFFCARYGNRTRAPTLGRLCSATKPISLDECGLLFVSYFSVLLIL